MSNMALFIMSIIGVSFAIPFGLFLRANILLGEADESNAKLKAILKRAKFDNHDDLDEARKLR